MCVYLAPCMYVCMYVCMYASVYDCMQALRGDLDTSIQQMICVCVYILHNVCMYASVCMYLCMCVYVCIQLSTIVFCVHTYIHT
jgi:hypothetical protein